MTARTASLLLSFVLALTALAPFQATAAERYFSTKAAQAVIMDYETGVVLYDKDASKPVPPASMSKLMTLAVLFDALQSGRITLDTEFYVSEQAWRLAGSKMFVLVNTTIPVRELIKGIIVTSGNDACLVIAQNLTADLVGQIEEESQLTSEAAFVALMNRKAGEWGLENSRFANATGLPDPDQLMSMHDLARLARHILTAYPEYYDFFSLEEYTWSQITQRNRNPLLGGFDGADGLKTGHTDQAGYGLVGTAFLDGTRRIIVLNGLESMNDRAREANRMMSLAFTEFDSRTFFYGGDIVGEAAVFMGEADTVPLSIRNDVTYTTHRRSIAGAKAQIVYNGPLKAPIPANEQVALLRIEMPGETEQEYPLYTTQAVKGTGLFGILTAGARALLTPPSAADIE